MPFLYEAWITANQDRILNSNDSVGLLNLPSIILKIMKHILCFIDKYNRHAAEVNSIQSNKKQKLVNKCGVNKYK